MGTTSSGRIAKPQRKKSIKNLTPHTKNHRWESFTTKIAKLHSLDPLRRVRRHDLVDEDLDATTSYLRNGLDRWAELNLSRSFVAFRREIDPLTRSLAQILHHEVRIMDLLAAYMAQKERESLEPLLDLLTAFAHDLGARFERHYPRALALIVDIASSANASSATGNSSLTGRGDATTAPVPAPDAPLPLPLATTTTTTAPVVSGDPVSRKSSLANDVEVIEWTFAALAFLFKYLSRLLVPDLRPTYDVVSPILGKAKKTPGHIARFAAEALSFLVKKTAAPAHRERALPAIIAHARNDLESLRGDRQFDLYSQGVMTLFAETMKGQGETLHSTAPDTLGGLIRGAARDKKEEEADAQGRQEEGGDLAMKRSVWADVCCGVLISVLHQSNTDTFQSVEARLIQEAVADAPTEADLGRAILLIRLLGTTAGVREGSRVHDWAGLVKALCKLLGRLPGLQEAASTPSSEMWQHVVVNSAMIFSQAPMDALIPCLSAFSAVMTREPLMRWYIPFCSYLSDMNPQRFRSLCQKDFQRFIVSHWSDDDNEDILCVLLPRMVESGGLPPASAKESCPLPQSWQDQIVSKFVRLEDTPFPESGGFGKDADTWRGKCLPRYSARLRLLDVTAVHPSTHARISEVLLKKLKLALRPSSSLPTDEANFIVSDGFHAYLRMSKAAGAVDVGLAPLLRAAAPRFCRSTAFLGALLSYENEIAGKKLHSDSDSSDAGSDGKKSPVEQERENRLVSALIANLSSPSHELRQVSLKILDILETKLDKSTLELMLRIEELPTDLPNMRTIALRIRKLALEYPHINEGSWLARAIPAYLFGMMTVPLAPVWDDTVAEMTKVAKHKTGEEAIAALAFEWLQVPSPEWGGPANPMAGQDRTVHTEFECSNLTSLHKTAEKTGQVIDGSVSQMLQDTEKGQAMVNLRMDRARSKALKVFAAIPALAEKRSRQLVPHLFSWVKVELTTTPEEGGGGSEGSDEERASPGDERDNWSFPDKKALMGVFAQFNNPRTLYQNQKVYGALLQLAASGDIEMQKLALKAIFRWKNDAVKAYRESLEYLLDEARFKNELLVLLQGDTRIRPEHKSDVMPVLLRLLYGRATSKTGRNNLHATRLAVVRNLDMEDMDAFLDIVLGKLRGVRIFDTAGGKLRESMFAGNLVPVRNQLGLLNMLEVIIAELGADAQAYMEALINAVLFCLISAYRNLREAEMEPENSEDPNDDDQDTGPVGDANMHKAVRTIALRCLCGLFRNAQTFDWTPYQDTIVAEVVSPRVDKFGAEMAQGISHLWRLLATWSVLPRSAMILAIDDRVLPNIAKCLSLENSKEEVKTFVLDMVKNLIHLAQAPATDSEYNELIKAELLDPNVDLILKEIGVLLRDHSELGRDLQAAAVETVVELAPMVQTSSTVVWDMVDITIFLLNQPTRKVNPKIKGTILLILKQFIVLDNVQASTDLKQRVFQTLGTLFGFFKDRGNRETLAEVLVVFASKDPSAQRVATLCADLNSYVKKRLDQPDFNKRLAAFNLISSQDREPFTIDQWMPLLHNLLFFVRHEEEFGVLASNSADGICRFVEATVDAWDGPERDAYLGVVSATILPAIYSGARERSETVRREFLRVFSFLVTRLGPRWEMVADLTPLMPESDEDTENENAFFFHVMSPAVSRQLQALRLLEQVNEKHEMGSKHISQFFVPLLEHFILGRPDAGDDLGVGAQAATATAALAVSLEWQQFRIMLRRFVTYLGTRAEFQKRVIRLLEKVVNTLCTAVSQRKAQKQKEEDIDSMLVDGDGEGERVVPLPTTMRRLAATLPAADKLSAEIVNNFLPTLLKHLQDKDEATVSARVPVAIIVAKLVMLLPEEMIGERLPGMLTDICHMLKSKAVEARDMARETLAKIAVIIGPDKFEFMLKELRAALVRGSQLHVLSYTMHSILLAIIPQFEQGSLDYCLSSIVAVIMDDVFGIVGQEKDAEDYTAKAKEVKSSKSQDSLELIARTASITCLGNLTKPLQALLMEKIDSRTAHKIDDLLTRVTVGLLANPAAASREVLVFCYEVVQEVYKQRADESGQRGSARLDPKLRRYLVQKAAKKSDRGLANKHTHKLVRFALDVLRAVLKRQDGLRTAGNMTGFIPILGDAVLAVEEEVKVAAFKLLVVIIKVPFSKKAQKANEEEEKEEKEEKEEEKEEEAASSPATGLYNVAVREAIKAISQSSSTASNLAQASLKLISAVLRDRHEVLVQDAAIDMLVGKLRDDLTEPQLRFVSFAFLRAVLDRHVETAGVYDAMDHVRGVMVTNEDRDTRNLARHAFFQFLRDYPQKRSRWQRQLDYVVANLRYEREGGRLSVMEVVHLLLRKTADGFVQEVAATTFIPLLFVVANDDSEKCRLAAGELLREMFRVADQEHMAKMLALLRTWIGGGRNNNKGEEPNVKKKKEVKMLALQVWGFYFEAREPDASRDSNDLALVVGAISEILASANKDSKKSGGDRRARDAGLVNTSLTTMQKLVGAHPQKMLSAACAGLWVDVREYMARSQDPVLQLTAIRLVSMLLADFASNGGNAKTTAGLTMRPLVGSHGLQMGQDDVGGLVRLALGMLNTLEVDGQLAQEVVRVVLFLARYLSTRQKPSPGASAADGEGEQGQGQEQDGGDLDGQGEEAKGEDDDDDQESEPQKAANIPTTTTLSKPVRRPDLPFLFHQLSHVLRRETPPRFEALVAKSAAMSMLEALCTGGARAVLTDTESAITPSLQTILLPLRNLTDAAIAAPTRLQQPAFGEGYEALRRRARELMEALQRRVGAPAYTEALLAVGAGVRDRREWRAGKRRIDAVVAPERAGRDKVRRTERKKERRREKGREARGARQGYL